MLIIFHVEKLWDKITDEGFYAFVILSYTVKSFSMDMLAITLPQVMVDKELISQWFLLSYII